MNKISKYSKWLVAGVMLASMPVFTACDDDDTIVVETIPTEFAVELNSINVTWDDVEGVAEFAADSKWKATSATDWITLDPTKGDAGVHRLYLNIEKNIYRMPRTGYVTITCGDQVGKITVVQGGCSDETKVPVANADVEVESLDYAISVVNFDQWADEIKGNLGLTMEEFGAAIDDDGDLEFFMVSDDGRWISGGTAGSRCGAWLDYNLNVCSWDPDGYPAIATWIEMWNEEEGPILIIGRAPGLPEDTEYTLKFGLTKRDDHSVYQIFNVDVVFPALDMRGTIIETIDLEATVPANNQYIPVTCAFDAAQVEYLLGCNSIADCKVVSYDADGEILSYTANNGYWYNARGEVSGYGDADGWFIEYWYNPDEPDADDYTSWYIGPKPNAVDVSAVSKIGFFYMQKVVMFNIHVTVGEAAPLETVEVIGINDLSITLPPSGYDGDYIAIDGAAICAQLGISALTEADIVSINENSEVLMKTAGDEGYWYNADGDVCDHGDNSAWYIHYYGNDPEEDPNAIFVGTMPGVSGVSGTCVFGFAHDGKCVLYNVTVTIQ